LEQDNGVTIFGAYRPGCAISVIPANGVLLSQEAAAGCTCSYPVRCSLAMIRKPNRTQPWTVYVTPGELKPVKHFAINFGAPADMKDQQGTVWFSYPNPKTNSYTHFPGYGVKFDLGVRTLPGMGYFCRDFKGFAVSGTDKPWLFTSGCQGLLRCEIPLVDDGAAEGPASYTVRMGFKAMPDDRIQERSGRRGTCCGTASKTCQSTDGPGPARQLHRGHQRRGQHARPDARNQSAIEFDEARKHVFPQPRSAA
ncbi:MAG: hypothetical protein ACYS74_24295, partial [Planctomycetota bacterium]